MRFCEKENIAKKKEEKNARKPIKKTQGNEDRANSDQYPNNIHSRREKRLDPMKAPVGKIELWLYIIIIDPTVTKVAENLPQHDKSKKNTKVN